MDGMDNTPVLLKLVLDELGLVSDWERFNTLNHNRELIIALSEDLRRRDILDLGYSRDSDYVLGDMGIRSLTNDVRDLEYVIENGEFPKKDLIPGMRKKLQDYKASKPFTSILSIYGTSAVNETSRNPCGL